MEPSNDQCLAYTQNAAHCVDEALYFLNEALDHMINASGGECGRDFTVAEGCKYSSIIKARNELLSL